MAFGGPRGGFLSIFFTPLLCLKPTPLNERISRHGSVFALTTHNQEPRTNVRRVLIMKRMLVGSAAALLLSVLSAVAHAVPIVSGSVWIVAPGVASAATPANVP